MQEVHRRELADSVPVVLDVESVGHARIELLVDPVGKTDLRSVDPADVKEARMLRLPEGEERVSIHHDGILSAADEGV